MSCENCFFPLTPIQEWFFEHQFEEPNHFNQSMALAVTSPIVLENFKEALVHLMTHHQTLRTRFVWYNGKWKQYVAQIDNVLPDNIFQEIHLTKMEQDKLKDSITSIAHQMQCNLDIKKGPVWKTALVNCDTEQYLVFIVHHLTIDGFSWRFLLEDLTSIYYQLQHRKHTLSHKTLSYTAWAEQLFVYANTKAVRSEISYWVKSNQHPYKKVPFDFDLGVGTVQDSDSLVIELDEAQTQLLLTKIHRLYDTEIEDILYAAITLTLAEWIDTGLIYISRENNGRNPFLTGIDISHTVGWFTSIYPICLQLPAVNDLELIIKSIKNQLRAIPANGFHYGLLRQNIKQVSTPQIVVDYFVDLDVFYKSQNLIGKFVNIPLGFNIGSKNKNLYPVEIGHWALAGKFYSAWNFSKMYFTRDTMQQVTDRFSYNLKNIILHCSERLGLNL